MVSRALTSNSEQDNAQPSAVAELHQQALIVKEVTPAAQLATIAGITLDVSVTPAGYREYLDQLLAAAGSPTDPFDIMLAEQLAALHIRIGQLHVDSACTTNAQEKVAFTLAAAKLTSEFRRTKFALKDSSRPPTKTKSSPKKGSASATKHTASTPADLLVGQVDHPDKQRTRKPQHGKPTHSTANCRPQESRTAQGADAERAAKTPRIGQSEPAVAVLDRPSDGRRQGTLQR